jgi:hypothetical protein
MTSRRRTYRSIPARAPTGSAWPAEMRAVTAAAFFDYRTTGELMLAIERGEAPRPTALRRVGRRGEPVWNLEICRKHIARRHEVANDADHDPVSIGSLV